MLNMAPDYETGTSAVLLREQEDVIAKLIQESGRRILPEMRDPRNLAAIAETAQVLDETFRHRRPTEALWQLMQQPRFAARAGAVMAMEADAIYRGYPIRSWQAGGDGKAIVVQEEMTTSDFPNIFGDTLNRRLLTRYQEQAISWPNYLYRNPNVRDFRKVRPIGLQGLNERWTNYKVGQLMPQHINNNMTETTYEYAVEKYRRGFTLSWEMFVNDDLGAFRDLPAQLAIGARRAEEYLACTMFADSSGPKAAVYNAGTYGNVITGNPPLSIQGLQTAMTVLGNMVDSLGEPITIDMIELVVPPALRVTAMNILNATQLELVPDSTADGQRLFTTNWMRGNVRVSVNAYLPQVITSGTKGNDSWFLFANPNSGRPAGEIGFLSGMEAPGLYQKAPNMMRLGGGVESIFGDFDTMGTEYGGLHVFGGTLIDPKMTIASDGSGS